MRFLAIALLLIASHLAQNNSENAEAKHKTFGQEKYKKIDGFVTGGHSMHSSFRKSTSGKKFAGYEMSSSISEMIDKITNGSGDIIALKSNIRSPYVYGLGAV
ncbi:MAG: hypothetical protein EZS28_040466 [Streblomastix strix]|uniref:Uncharacterized protein n=1 Tax=Streblomastix strix TaxID=222440 RepID=A0A5J4U0X7_9EUKA|nr:MAG: hypothetical protein EZS28_040466 [Streblomastix strix]